MLLLAVSGCQHEDIWNELREHEQRIEQLEKQCRELNTNIEAIQAILTAIQQNDYVTEVMKIMEDGIEVGYSITFAKGGTVTIYHGTNGADGAAPQISIKKAQDGEYYWTADGEWMTDENGERIPAVVADDPNGEYVTPQFRVADGKWYVSYDNGNTWQEYTKVGSDSGDNSLIDIQKDDNGVYYWLINGEWLLDDNGNKIPVHIPDASNQSRNITDEFIFTDRTSVTAATGAIGTSTQIMKSSDYVDLQNASHLRLSFMKWTSSTGAASGYGLAFYNSSKQFLKGFGFPTADAALGNSSGESYDLKIEIPSDARYVRTTYHMDENIYGNFYAHLIFEDRSSSDNIKYPHYNVIGSPHIYITDWEEKDNISPFADVSSIYSAYDELARKYPRYFKRNEDIGTDASGIYTIRHYSLGMADPTITSDREGQTENLWDETSYPRRRVLLNCNIHGWSERFACYGAFLTVKEILESNEEWALFIRNNFVLEIIPEPNPWGYDNKTSTNSDGYNLNRTYFSNIQPENEAVISLVETLIPQGLIGIIDYHNTGDSTSGYLVSKPSYKRWSYYAVLTSQLEAICHDSFLVLEGQDQDNFFHLWDATGNEGQLHHYADHMDLLGCTFEVGSKYGANGAILSKMLAINLINAFGTYEGI